MQSASIRHKQCESVQLCGMEVVLTASLRGLQAAGAAVSLVDAVVDASAAAVPGGSSTTGFGICRPPGHHAVVHKLPVNLPVLVLAPFCFEEHYMNPQ